LYWYIRLRKKKFRHAYALHLALLTTRLVLGLIASETVQSLCQLIYPAKALSVGDIFPTDVSCKVIGFFTSYCVEASDLMIFIIAIHTALYVFNPKFTNSGEERGLWRWRHS